MTAFPKIIPSVAGAIALICIPFPGISEEKDAPAGGGSITLDFEGIAPGEVPEETAFVIDGDFRIVARGDNQVLEIAEAPLVESGALVGGNLEGDVVISAKAHATSKGRSHPRFGVGTHGMSGYRMRVVPARKVVELVYREGTVAEVPFVWKSGTWLHLKLSVTKGEGEMWSIVGKVWAEGEAEPEEPTLERTEKELRGKGKASVWGTPYSGTPIAFDDVVVIGKEAP